MSTIAMERPVPTVRAMPAPPHRRSLTAEHKSSMRRSLEDLITRFESERFDLIAVEGAVAATAYDVGLKHAVHAALDEMRNGHFGTCRACSTPIDVERLRATPYARRCATCQHHEEARWNEFERMVAGVVRARAGEPQGRAVTAPVRHRGPATPRPASTPRTKGPSCR